MIIMQSGYSPVPQQLRGGKGGRGASRVKAAALVGPDRLYAGRQNPIRRIQLLRKKRLINAGTLLVSIIILIRISLAYGCGWAMIGPLFLSLVWLTRTSPPLVALLFLYGWPLLGMLEITQITQLPRLPIISLLTVWAILWLIIWRLPQGLLHQICRLRVLGCLLLLACFWAVGLLSSYQNGLFQNAIIRFFIWDTLRSTAAYIVFGILSCRNREDLKILLIGLPFAFWLFPLSFPMEALRNFFGALTSVYGIFGVGLNYGSLNPNTLGQAAAVASIAATTGILHFSKRRRLRNFLIAATILSVTITFMTASRHSVLALVGGWIFIFISRRSFRRAAPVLGFVAGLFFAVYLAFQYVPKDSGFRARFGELLENPTSWTSQSYALRRQDWVEAYQSWRTAPIFGHGFGGQRLSELSRSADITDGSVQYSLRGTHSLFLGVLAQTGAIGFILFVGFYLITFFMFLGSNVRHPISPDHPSHFLRSAVGAIVVCILLTLIGSGGLGLSSATQDLLFGALLMTSNGRGNPVRRSWRPIRPASIETNVQR
jgi:O-antigen ligase